MLNFSDSTEARMLKRVIIFLLAFIVSSLDISCSHNSAKQNGLLLSVDMSKEHDSGQFKPGKGDRLYVAGNFNGWKKYQIAMTEKKGNWIYSANIEKYLEKTEAGLPIDTLQFNFLIKPGKDRSVPNQGWEELGARKMAVSTLASEAPVFVYGERFDNKEPYDVTFTVGMSNEETLGFFKPGRGDEVVVSGSFCNWSSKGIPLDNKGDGIYARKIWIRQNPRHPLEYNFRIIPNANVPLPNWGWETIPMRKTSLDSRTIKLPFAVFNNIRRVARFVIGTSK